MQLFLYEFVRTAVTILEGCLREAVIEIVANHVPISSYFKTFNIELVSKNSDEVVLAGVNERDVLLDL